ncbi:MAG: BatA and WFA domain-containing protein [Elusimicrobiota bacterium]|nr:BatA and WFA domain-containing protein [Elusimicrobiota bacterium]
MTFLNPVFLFFLPLAGVPVLIHLINRQKVKKLDFPTLRFLMPSTQKTLKRFRLLELLLLAARVLAILLLTLGFARPVWQGSAEADEDVKKIILIDNSYTMGYRKGEGSVLSFSRDLALKIIARNEGPWAAGVFNNGLKELTPFSNDAREIAGYIQSIELSEETSDLPSACRELLSRLEDLNYGGTFKIMVFSDFKNSGSERRALSDIPGAYNFLLIDTNDGRRNKAVSRVRKKSYFSGSRTPVEAGIYSYDESPTTAELIIDGVKRNSLRVNSKGEKSVSFNYTFTSPGAYRAEVRVSGRPENNRIEKDSSYYFKAVVRPQLNVLLIEGDSGYTFGGGGSYFISRALGSENLQIPVHFRVISDEQMKNRSLDEYDIIFLLNVGAGKFEQSAIIDFARVGGGVGIFAGDNVDAAAYSRLTKTLMDIDLARPESAEGAAVKPEGKETLKDIFTSDSSIEVKKYISAAERYSPRASLYLGNIPVFWTSPDAWPYRAAFIGLTAGSAWSDFPIKSAYPVFIDKLISYLAGTKISETENYTVGDTLTRVESPQKIRISGEPISSRAAQRYPVAAISGNYILPGEEKIIPVNIDRAGGGYRLEETGKSALEEIFSRTLWGYIPYSQELYADIIEKTEGSRKSAFFFGAAFMVLLIEELLRKKLSKDEKV